MDEDSPDSAPPGLWLSRSEAARYVGVSGESAIRAAEDKGLTAVADTDGQFWHKPAALDAWNWRGKPPRLELVARHPECIRRLIAHDAPVAELLSLEERQEFLQLRKRVGEIALSEGMQPAMRHFLSAIGVDNDDREEDAEPPPSSRERARNSGFFLSRESRAADAYRLDLATLSASGHLVMPAFGISSERCFPARCSIALARALGKEALPFPGGHTGYVLRPRAFSDALRTALFAAPRPAPLPIPPADARGSLERLDPLR